MKIENNKVSFLSKIKFVDYKTFKTKTAHLNPRRHEVGWPWSADTMKTGKNLFTTDIMDCIAVGIKDGSKFELGHLATFTKGEAKKCNQKGFQIENVKRRLLENINLDNENLHGFILGGLQEKPDSKYNVNKLNKIKQIFEENKIPYTIFGARKGAVCLGKYSLLYSNKEDTLYISNNLADIKTRIRRKPPIDVKENSIEFNTFKKEYDENGAKYVCTRKETGTEEFFKSQFRQVNICNIDEII